MKILVLGAGGVFGQNFADYAERLGNRVIGIGRSPRKQKCFSLGVSFPYKPYHLVFELDYVLKEIEYFKPDVIVNFAAQGEGAASWGSDNWRFFETNCTALIKLVSAINCHFIQIGSSEVYGSVNTPVDEQALTHPTSPYSVSKLAFDQYLVAMHKVKGLPMNIIRPSNCYAPGQQLHRIIPKTILYGLTGRKLQLHGGGVSRKSYLHASDLSSAIMRVIKGGTMGEIYNVGPDNPTSIKEVVWLCLTATGRGWDLVEESAERMGQDGCYWLNSDKIKALGWQQVWDWDAGLKDMVDWVKSYPELTELPTDFTMRA